MPCIPEQIVGIGQDFHSQLDDGKAKTPQYRVRWKDIIGRMIESHHASTGICQHGKSVQGIGSHQKILRGLLLTVSVRQKQRKHMTTLILPNLAYCAVHERFSVWTCGIFQTVTGESRQCIKRTKRINLTRLAFGIQHAQDADLSPDMRTCPIWSSTISHLELMTT